MAAIIRIEGLSKKYSIRHRRQEPYIALRDVITENTKFMCGKIWRAALRKDMHSAPYREEFWALKDVNLEIQRGECVGVIGRNGAGKTTLLKLISRITSPTTGRIYLKGRVASLLEVGTGFHPELTGRENIYLNGGILGMRKWEIDKRFDEIVDFAEVEKFLDTPVKHYSSGMYMRLAFAVAAHLEPEIMVIDEVLAVGDAVFQKKCLGKMQDVVGAGHTILFVSHSMAAIKALCNSAMLLDNGFQVCAGNVTSVISRYLQSSIEDVHTDKLPDARHRLNTGELFIERVNLKNSEGQLTTQIRMAETLTFNITFEIRQPLREIRIGIGVNTLDGVRVATFHHTDNGAAPFSGGCGIYEVALSMSNPFLPGNYIVSVGAHRALGGITIDYVPEALRLDITEISANNENYQVYNSGLVHFHSSWLSVRKVR